MFIPRVFVPSVAGERITVTDESDINHIRNVLRIPVGGKVTLCDGKGAVCRGEIAAFTESGLDIRITERLESDSEFPFSVTVYQCYPKGEKAETVVQKAVELGATEIVFVMSERCVARPDDKSMAKKRERLQKIADAAAAQCGRGVLPAVRGLIPYSLACAEAAGADCAFLCYEGEGTKPLRQLLQSKPNAGSYAFLIGPEGGIAPKEAEEAARAGLALAGLGKRILRTETAPLFVLSAINVLC